jgi:hypothetical protein
VLNTPSKYKKLQNLGFFYTLFRIWASFIPCLEVKSNTFQGQGITHKDDHMTKKKPIKIG